MFLFYLSLFTYLINLLFHLVQLVHLIKKLGFPRVSRLEKADNTPDSVFRTVPFLPLGAPEPREKEVAGKLQLSEVCLLLFRFMGM